MTWVSAAAATASLTMGIIQKHKANKALKELAKNKPAGYTVSPELQGAFTRAESMTGSGFSAQEKAAFEQNVARDQNTAYSNALNQGGGNLAQTLAMGLQGQKLQAESTFAADDASLRRQNIQYADSLAKQIQDQKNLATGQNLADYKDKEIAFGEAGKAGMENIYKGIGAFGSAFGSLSSGAFTGGSGGGSKMGGGGDDLGFDPSGMEITTGPDGKKLYNGKPAWYWQDPQKVKIN